MTNKEIISTVRTVILAFLAVTCFLGSCTPIDMDSFVNEQAARTKEEIRADTESARTGLFFVFLLFGTLAAAPAVNDRFQISFKKKGV